MKNYIFCTIAVCMTAACMGSGGSGGSSSTNPFVTASPSTVTSDPAHVASNLSFTGFLNALRPASGVGAVAYDARLGAAAQTHANDMLANNFLNHRGSDGSVVQDRVTAQGYDPRVVAENIARDGGDEITVLNSWLRSPDSYDEIFDPAFEDFAIARAGSGANQYWVLVLAAERP